MSLSVDFSGWQVRQGVGGSQLVADEAGGERLGDELSQDYDFSGLNWTWGTPDGRANMRIDCRLEKGFSRMFVNTFLHFYLRPFRLKQETKLIVRLYTADRMKRAEVPVIATPITGVQEKGPDWVGCAIIGTREDTQKCINVLATGQQLDFLLFREKQFKDDKQKEEFEEFCDGVGPVFLDQLVKLPLPPDKIFKEVYDESFRRIADAKDESTKAPLLDREKNHP